VPSGTPRRNSRGFRPALIRTSARRESSLKRRVDCQNRQARVVVWDWRLSSGIERTVPSKMTASSPGCLSFGIAFARRKSAGSLAASKASEALVSGVDAARWSHQLHAASPTPFSFERFSPHSQKRRSIRQAKVYNNGRVAPQSKCSV